MKILGLMKLENMSLKSIEAIKNANSVILQSGRDGYYEEICTLNKNVHTLDDLFENAQNYEDLYKIGGEEISKYDLFCYIGHVNSNGFIRQLNGEVEYIDCNYDVSYCVFMANKYFDIQDYTVINAANISNAYLDTSKGIVITDIDSISRAIDVKLKISEYYENNTCCIMFDARECVKQNPYELDKIKDFKTGLTLVLPPLAIENKLRYSLYDAVKIMEVLRGEDGCPWDIEQTHKSLRPYLLEEGYEVVEAIDEDDIYALFDELGDVLLQVLFHGQIAKECSEGDIEDISTALCKKMIGRHPHVFLDAVANTSNEVLANWEEIKRKEKGQESVSGAMKGIAKSLGAMMRAEKIQKKAALVGFDFTDYKEAFLKVEEELKELNEEINNGDKEKINNEAGDLLFSIINVMRLLKLNSELALSNACEKFISRFEYIEKNASKPQMTVSDMEKLWKEAKNTSKT